MVNLMELIRKIYHLLVDTKIITLAASFAFFFCFNSGSYLFLFISLSNYLSFDFRSLTIINLDNGLLKDILLYLINHNTSLTHSLFLVITSIYSSSSLYYHFIHISDLLVDSKIENKRLKSITVTLIFLFLVSMIFSGVSVFLSYNYQIYKTIISISVIVIIFLVVYMLNVIGMNTLKISRLYTGVLFSVM